ncbi:MAG: hypothetical protein ACJASV_000739 [Pseudorhodobacter sp.]|jgi:hypothetical protein
MATGRDLSYQTNASATAMAEAIFGEGVTVVDASYSGPRNSSAIYTNGDRADGVTPSDSGVILSTGNVDDFTQNNGDPNRSTGTSTNTTGTDNDAAFNALAGSNTFDAVWIDVDFIPTGDTMTMSFVFASEEYPEFINSQFNDVIGVWINGNLVPISIGNGLTSVNNLNVANQQNLVVDNTNDAFNTEMDGFTVTLSLTIPVNSGVLNSIRIGIADTADSSFDSSLLIAGNSVQTALIAHDDAITIAPGATKIVDVLANDTGPSGGTLIITHINGQAVTAGSTVTLASGQQITLNADGTFTIVADGDTEDVSFTYEVALGNGNGLSDIGIVNLSSIPCFVAGTGILTPNGEVPVESLQPGDLVLTHDEGPQPLRWIGRRRVEATGAFAPIHIRARTFGNHRALKLSPLHRVLIRDSLAELLFGEPEVLVAAKDLVNDRSVRVMEGGEVEYVHLLFDKHQVIYSAGLATESFLPGPHTAKSFEQDIVDEICALFPEIDPNTGAGYSPAARRTLKSFEAQVLVRAARVA